MTPSPTVLLTFFLLPIGLPAAAVEVLAVRNLDMTLNQPRTTVTVQMPAALPEAAGKKLGLYLEGIEWGRTGTFFEVYANLPEGAEPKPEGPHYLGTLSSYGAKGAGATVGYDVTHLVHTLEAEGRWDGRLTLTFVRRGLLPPRGQEKPELRPRIPESPAVTRIRQVKLVRE